ncbi:DUF3293 domain-containing protein [Asaia platycodi]|uniref:DUF3293 domain-containing protein n=1 Tax=Asaia platycodi TaxID=610243 RepID=UPI00046E7DCF|nr:DUF3293 domain-containing protein [Asaia platycodi]
MSRVRPPTPVARKAYRQTSYAIGPVILRIGVRPICWPFEAQPFVLIGACNPSGLRLSDTQNARRMQHPRARLGTARVLNGEGRWRGWSEPFFAAALPMAKARVLARIFGQNALVHVSPGRPLRLVWLA